MRSTSSGTARTLRIRAALRSRCPRTLRWPQIVAHPMLLLQHLPYDGLACKLGWPRFAGSDPNTVLSSKLSKPRSQEEWRRGRRGDFQDRFQHLLFHAFKPRTELTALLTRTSTFRSRTIRSEGVHLDPGRASRAHPVVKDDSGAPAGVSCWSNSTEARSDPSGFSPPAPQTGAASFQS